MTRKRQDCFVIMPFGQTTNQHTDEYWTQQFDSFLKPLIEENRNLRARRSEALRGDILTHIITDLIISPVVLADLTDHNPNVYWELGVRQSFKHRTVTIAEAGTQLPFDIGRKGTLFYFPNEHMKNEKFRKSLKGALQDCLDHPETPDSQVLEVIAGRGTLFGILHRDEAIRRLDALLDEVSRHLVAIKAIDVAAKANGRMSIERFSFSATELLVTDRYVDEDRDFYQFAQRYYQNLLSLNAVLDAWPDHRGGVDKWLPTTCATMTEDIANFIRLVKVARDRLSRLQ
jgi:hypothetical protein